MWHIIDGQYKDLEYIKNYVELHNKDSEFGSTSISYYQETKLMIECLSPKTVLDFGCGKGSLVEALRHEFPDITFLEYDPAIPGKNILPNSSVDLVICTDVLEHIPEAILDSVLNDIHNLSGNVFFSLHHTIAWQILPDGTNAHCTVKPPAWYHMLFDKYFPRVLSLPGRTPYTSIVITFPFRNDWIMKYYSVIGILSNEDIAKNLASIHKELSEISRSVKILNAELEEVRNRCYSQMKMFPQWFCKLIGVFIINRERRVKFYSKFMKE